MSNAMPRPPRPRGLSRRDDPAPRRETGKKPSQEIDEGSAERDELKHAEQIKVIRRGKTVILIAVLHGRSRPLLYMRKTRGGCRSSTLIFDPDEMLDIERAIARCRKLETTGADAPQQTGS